MTSSLTNVETLSRFILAQKKIEPGLRNDYAVLLGQIGLACKVVGNAVRRAGIEHLLGQAGITNVQGEEVKKLDLVANGAFIHALTKSERVCAMVSEEDAECMFVDKSVAGEYAVTFDPLDGSSNIDCNVSVGSIFGIYKRKSAVGDQATVEDCLQPGRDLICAGYALYGSTTMLVISIGNGVHGFTLDGSLGEFVLTHEDIKIKKKGQIFSVNEGNSKYWAKSVKDYVEYLKGDDDRKPYSARYIGSMVSDVHRTLLYGGIFMYPGDSRAPNGKLRYLYEVGPLSFLMDQAGGSSSNGTDACLDIVPTQIHQRSPVFMGSNEDVWLLESFVKKAKKADAKK
eukprot:TRINITY_DN8811_c0_g1_i1.p1 TRINITY_DN8811_c0_g1~~TRINITY_DN8811_c0_g1_i1.p1  ORF type:complete len:353 (+),score=95.31 TRINITY_DN8811_c0_g1_i1:36-1061(+)